MNKILRPTIGFKHIKKKPAVSKANGLQFYMYSSEEERK